MTNLIENQIKKLKKVENVADTGIITSKNEKIVGKYVDSNMFMTGRQKPPQEEKKFGSPLKCKKIEEKLKKTPRNPTLKRLNTPDTKTKSQRKPKFNADKHKKIFNFFLR